MLNACMAFAGTPTFEQSRDERKKVEMRFVHLKTYHRFERMRLRGSSGAHDKFHLAATVQSHIPGDENRAGKVAEE